MRGETDARAGAGARTLLAALLLFVAGLCLQPITESDLFFRLKVGQQILATHRLPGRNLFSFTAPDYPDLDLSWAFEVAAALLHRWGGFPAVVAAKAVWMMTTFAAAFGLCRRRGAAPVASTLALAAAAFVMRDRLVERPHIVSFAGEIAVLWALDTVGRPWPRSRVAMFALAMVAWANMHAGIFAGVLLSVLGAAGVWATGGFRGQVKRAAGVAAMIAVAAAINPVGPRGIVRYLGLHLTLPRLHTIDEFRAATWRSDAPFFLWLLALGLVGGAALARWRGRSAGVSDDVPRIGGANRRGWRFDLDGFHVMPVLGMVVLGLASVRFSADAALVGAPLMAVGLMRVWRHRPPRIVAPATVGALIAAALIPRLVDARAGRPAWDVNVDTSVLPLDALRFVENNGLRERMYNDFEMGSYLLFQGYPRYRVFVDPRLPAYPEDIHSLLGTFDLDRGVWDAAMNRYGVESALLSYAGVNRRVAWWDPNAWALVYRAHDARVFIRRREKWRAVIAAHEIPATFVFSVERGTATRLLETKPSLSPVADCEWQRRLGELTFELAHENVERARPYFERALAVPGCLAWRDEAALSGWMGALDMGANDGGGRALDHLSRALVLVPGDTASRANRATVLERLGRWSDAAADWTRVAAGAPGSALGQAATARARKLSAREAPASIKRTAAPD